MSIREGFGAQSRRVWGLWGRLAGGRAVRFVAPNLLLAPEGSISDRELGPNVG